jgi:hypothetical protein
MPLARRRRDEPRCPSVGPENIAGFYRVETCLTQLQRVIATRPPPVGG